MSQLICKDLSLGYNDNLIIKELSFSVEKGDYLCIIGENGAGKTTLMKAILGLLKPISGSIVWGDGLHKNEIGYLTQQSEIQKEFPASVTEIVLSGFQSKCGIRPFYNKKEKAEAKDLMHKLGIDALSKRCYRELSGGQQQRVLLARALCATQKILFLDEPVSGLDPQVSHDMYELIKSLNTIEGVTIIMISHDIRASLKYSSHILKIGNNSFFGTKEEYLSSDLYRAEVD
ncbi:MAG: ABC transporter ATP-binding protein [Clostridia bacterium]